MAHGWAHLAYAAAWLSFGVLHSVLAARSVKDGPGRPLGRAYRIAYNGFAVVHLAVVWLLGRELLGAYALSGLPGWWPAAGMALTVAGVAVMAVAIFDYDRARFLGIAQLGSDGAAEDEPLRIGGLHRFVRHPLYSGLFLFLWGRAQSEFGLATAVWASLYLVIGTAFEERRLVALYGEAYSAYRRRVPAFVPWKGMARDPDR